MSQKIIAVINTVICLLLTLAGVLSGRHFLIPLEYKENNTPIQYIEKINDPDWAYFLINAAHPLPDDYIPDLKEVVGDFYLDERCADYAVEMVFAAEQDGIRLHITSAYRSRQMQDDAFNRYVERLINESFSESEAVIITASQIAAPGASEHNAGLALDIISEDWFMYNDDYTEAFDQTLEFRWLADNSWRFGFILRYPKGGEEITGFIYEPWHYRFVGHEKAEQIYNSGFTLEEYIERYPPY